MERQGSGLWRSLMTDENFEEEDVWDVLREKKDSISRSSKSMDSFAPVPKQLLSAARMIPKATINTSTSSSSSTSAASSNQTIEAKPFQQSAPVTIPNWPKNYLQRSKDLTPKNDNGHGHDDDDVEDFDGGDDDDDDVDVEEEEIPKMPPHELIARRLARTHISSFSVLEGVGRKLKGRDLSEVRNAILAKTGFL
ncbi:transcription initiation factor TFIID subunit 11 [Tripterygium wilfordii]|uniref:Transcription initiation factor TFIID subunit 11 n=1 Tax=Tripterygium wilfordii TaxID=458696 RepID=A0A7J7C3G9_TRIWF|nr:uncharacterized protein LOC119989514 [Tripterygium wilfordii]KAF5728407.1 transcription initiation factor TFIID subunit 11 [Tripterygium wilfordii]